MGVRKTVEAVINGVKEIRRVPNVPNMSTEHPLYVPPVSELGQIERPPLIKDKK